MKTQQEDTAILSFYGKKSRIKWNVYL